MKIIAENTDVVFALGGGRSGRAAAVDGDMQGVIPKEVLNESSKNAIFAEKM